jgi:hypothetical protein
LSRPKSPPSIPQGSVLGLLFFLLYVNDMVRVSGDLGFVLFADDTNLFAEGSDPVKLFDRVNRGLVELDRWFRCNRPTLNLKKTEYVYFAGPRPPEVPPGGLVIGGEQARRKEGVKFLGVRIDAGLKWRDHMGKVGTKVRQLLGVLGRIRSVLDERLLVSLYNSMVLPHLQYCLMASGGFESDRNKAQGETFLKFQKRYVGLIAAKRGLYHADPLSAKYGILKVGDLYRQQLRLNAWKFSNGRLLDSQGAILRRVGESRSYGTRSARSGLVVGTGDLGW